MKSQRRRKTPPPAVPGSQKIPRNIPDSPTGKGVVTLSKLQRGIIRRLKTKNRFCDVAREMKCDASTVSHTFHQPAVQAYLRREMEAAGITHGLLMQRIREGLDATQEGRGVDDDGQPIPITDYKERREHAKMALRLQGLDTAPDGEAGKEINHNTLCNIVINARESRGLDRDK